MPLGKKRVLPDWMVGAGKRVGVGEKKKEPAAVVEAPKPVKARVSHKAAAPRSTTKTKAKR